MTRQLLFAIILAGTGAFLNSPAVAASDLRCENRFANCVGRCANFTGGAGDYRGHQNKCMVSCDRRVTQCLSMAYIRRW